VEDLVALTQSKMVLLVVQAVVAVNNLESMAQVAQVQLIKVLLVAQQVIRHIVWLVVAVLAQQA
jgi:hypothetical protein